MRKTNVNFTDAQYRQLAEIAHERRVGVSELVREILEAHYGLPHEEVHQGKKYASPTK